MTSPPIGPSSQAMSARRCVRPNSQTSPQMIHAPIAPITLAIGPTRSMATAS